MFERNIVIEVVVRAAGRLRMGPEPRSLKLASYPDD